LEQKEVGKASGCFTMKPRIPFLLLLLTLLMFGCIDPQYYERSTAGEGAVLDMSLANACPTGDCMCMACDAHGMADPVYAKFYTFSYYYEECKFTKCNETDFNTYMNAEPNNEKMNFFMIGQGGFGEFNKANPYCNNSLRMPVKWLDSRYGAGEYPLPDARRAGCFLDKGSIPLYILYSRGQSVSPSRAEEIAHLFSGTILGDMGPIIITAEFEFNSSNPAIRENVSAQVKAMKRACPDCLIALAPRIWDNSTELEEMFQDQAFNNSVDLFAFGINSHDFNTCDPTRIYSDAVQYSEYLLYKYKKPSVWAYILFDNDWSADQSCHWDESLLSRAYTDFYTYQPAFPSTGVIGASLYSMYGIGSLNCTDCGLFNISGDPIASRQASWFSNCQGLFATSSVLPIVFSNAPGTTCAFGQSAYSYVGDSSFYTEQPVPTEPAGAWPQFYSCDSCMVEVRPASIMISPNTAFSDRACTDFPVLDVYSDIRDIDPAYVRALVWWESGGFDDCEVGTSGAPCGRVTPMYEVVDPDGRCPAYATPSYQRPSKHACDMGLIPVFSPPEDYWAGITFKDWMYAPEGELAIAKACAGDEKFNPFNVEHNVCLGTYEVAQHIKTAEGIVASNEGRLGLTAIKNEYGEEEYENAKGLVTLFIARTQFIAPEVWSTYGNKWMNDFTKYSNYDDHFCSGTSDHQCCDSGHVRYDLRNCCGSSDFISFVTDDTCWTLTGTNVEEKYRDPIMNAKKIMALYLGVREKCGICDGEKWRENVEEWASRTPEGPRPAVPSATVVPATPIIP